MKSSKEADALSEKMVHQYLREMGVETDVDVSNAMEMFISKAARAVEAYCSPEQALHLLERTKLNIILRPVEIVKEG